MKSQVLFSPKDKSNKLKCRLLQFLFGALRVKVKCTSSGAVPQPSTSLSPLQPGVNSQGKDFTHIKVG